MDKENIREELVRGIKEHLKTTWVNKSGTISEHLVEYVLSPTTLELLKGFYGVDPNYATQVIIEETYGIKYPRPIAIGKALSTADIVTVKGGE